jgi:hypothetical protein
LVFSAPPRKAPQQQFLQRINNFSVNSRLSSKKKWTSGRSGNLT